jgi:enolase
MIALDCAAEFYVNGKYDYSKFEGETGKIRSSAEQVDYLAELVANIQLSLKMEWMKMTGMDGNCLQIKLEIKFSWGDDLFVTNVERLSQVSKEVLLINFNKSEPNWYIDRDYCGCKYG